MAATMEQLLNLVVEQDASDLHLIVGSPPMVRKEGRLLAVQGEDVLTPEASQELVFAVLNNQQKEILLNNKEIDLSYQFGNAGRFRINAYFQRGSIAAALRLIPTKIRGLQELNLPPIVHELATLRQGFVLVTGPTGHGKSSTLAALLEQINETRAEHIITIEDPIEFLHTPKRSIISQREVHGDTHSWQVALRSALREDPDVVLVGEMRDFETIAAALTVAETGHLVLATLHTNSAAQTIDRVIDVFPEHQQAQVRMQLSNTIEAVLAQRLIPDVEGGRVPALEILLANSAVRNTIREGKTHQLDNVIQTSGELGMMSLEASLAYWVKAGKVEEKVAKDHSLRPEELARLIKGHSANSGGMS